MTTPSSLDSPPAFFDGRRRRRRRLAPAPLSSSSSPPASGRYAIVVRGDAPIGGIDSPSDDASNAQRGSLVKIARISVPPSSSAGGRRRSSENPNEEGELILCLREEGRDRAEIYARRTPPRDERGDEGGHSHSRLSGVLDACCAPSEKYALFAAEDEDGRESSRRHSEPKEAVVPTECVNFLQYAVSSWYAGQFPNRTGGKKGGRIDVPRKDAKHLCNVLAPRMRTMSRHSFCHHCTCDRDGCVADAIVTALGIDDDDVDCFKENRTRSQRHIMLQSAKDYESHGALRLMVAERIEDRISGENDARSDGISAQSQSFGPSGGGLVAFLPSSKKVPLISVTLRPKEGIANANGDIISDALLRACVKRLLVGRVLLHSEVQTKGAMKAHAAASPSDVVSSLRTCLSVEVPQNPSISKRGRCERLEFRVADIQSSGGGETRRSTLYVILPSTRIIFQSHEEKGGSTPEGKGGPPQTRHDEQQSNASYFQLAARISPSPSHPAHSPVSPHQHLVESLRSIMLFQTHGNGRPPIPRSFLLSGPPGVGKTYSVKKAISIANSWSRFDDETRAGGGDDGDAVRLVSLRGSELLASASGGSAAAAARELERQFRSASNSRGIADGGASGESNGGPRAVVVFLDECDALVSSPVVAAVLAAVLDEMEGVVVVDPDGGEGGGGDDDDDGWGRVLLVAATNRIDAIPGFLRRPGRLEKEVVVGPPDADERLALLRGMLGSSGNTAAARADDPPVGADEPGLRRVAEACVGYVAADLSALVRRAAMLSVEERFRDRDRSTRRPGSPNRPTIAIEDLFSAMNDVGASCLRDASLSAPPETTWADIAGDAGGAKRALREAIEWPRTRRAAFEALGLSPPRGVLLHGPPGCAKTTLARAAAGAAGVAFLSLSPADVYASSYVGEAEGVVRRAFDLARSAAPCVLFFDEIDAIIGGDDEGGNGEGGHGMGRGASAEARVLSTFLNEMDGVDGSVDDGVLVLGATNRPRTLDAALLRPGRFDRVIYVPPPDEPARRAILSMECGKWRNALLARSPPGDASPTSNGAALSSDGIEEHFDLGMLASDPVSGSMTGAEVVGACRETAAQVMRTMMRDRSESADRLLRSLMAGLEASLRSKTPLLSNPRVLEEYTKFEDERK